MSPAIADGKTMQLYSTVQNYEKILDMVRRGRVYFQDEVRNRNLRPSSTSHVHSDGDVEVHAFALSIPSAGNGTEMIIKSFLVYSAHLLDDHFDNKQLNDRDRYGDISKHRQSHNELLGCMGKVGGLGHYMAHLKGVFPYGVYKALQRMAFGGLIQLADNQGDQEMYMGEHKDLALQMVDGEFRGDVQKISPLTYWLTTKTVLEMFFAAEPSPPYDPTLAESWNLVYAPALYVHNAAEELDAGEMNFFDNEPPTTDEMLGMIDIGSHYIKKRSSSDSRLPQRVDQLTFLRRAFEPVLPGEISQSYERLVGDLLSV
jgi:hypothetical protein